VLVDGREDGKGGCEEEQCKAAAEARLQSQSEGSQQKDGEEPEVVDTRAEHVDTVQKATERLVLYTEYSIQNSHALRDQMRNERSTFQSIFGLGGGCWFNRIQNQSGSYNLIDLGQEEMACL
jgi:hypothetical protein